MILVKNKLKKKKVMGDDDMLNYLKFSHLDTSKRSRINREDDGSKNIENKSTQFLQTQDKATQTIGTEDKGVDTGNDFGEVIPPYVSFIHSEDFDRNEKMIQVWTKMFRENLTPSPPSSSSSSSGNEGFPSKMARGGFRLAEFALNTAITTANLTMALSDALVDLTSAPHQSSEEEQQNNPEVISVHSSPPITVNSSSPPQTINSSSSSSRQTPTSVPAPTSPQSSPASSAKTTPRKKSK